MNFLHYEFNLQAGDHVIVTLDKQANVQLMDTTNFSSYQSGRRYTYYGGLATVSPFSIQAPSSGNWHVAIDTGGYPGTVRASVSVSRR